MGNIRYCRQCGHALSEESRFCEYCGARVEQEAPVGTQDGTVFSPRGDSSVQKTTSSDQRRRVPAGSEQRPSGSEQGSRTAGTNARPGMRGEAVRRQPVSSEQRQAGSEQRRRTATSSARPGMREEAQRRQSVSGEQRRMPQEAGERRTRYQQERLQGRWEESWNRELPEEDERRITPVQYLLLGLIAILIAALAAFGLFWMKGRSGSRKTQDEKSAQVVQTETTKTVSGKDSGNDSAITILDGDGQAQSESMKQTSTAENSDGQKAETKETTGRTTEKQTEKTSEKQSEKSTEKQTGTVQTEEPQTQSGSYILPQSSERLLTDSDVAGMSYDDMQMAINEIYARHGRKFSSQSVQSYFDGQPWYQGTVEPNDFSDSVFSQVEGQNVLFLLKKMGIE